MRIHVLLSLLFCSLFAVQAANTTSLVVKKEDLETYFQNLTLSAESLCFDPSDSIETKIIADAEVLGTGLTVSTFEKAFKAHLDFIKDALEAFQAFFSTPKTFENLQIEFSCLQDFLDFYFDYSSISTLRDIVSVSLNAMNDILGLASARTHISDSSLSFLKARDAILNSLAVKKSEPSTYEYYINYQNLNVFIFSHLIPKYFMGEKGKFASQFISDIKKALNKSKNTDANLTKLKALPADKWATGHVREALTLLYGKEYKFSVDSGAFKNREKIDFQPLLRFRKIQFEKKPTSLDEFMHQYAVCMAGSSLNISITSALETITAKSLHKGMKGGVKVVIVLFVGGLLIISGAVAVYFLYWKKRVAEGKPVEKSEL